MFTLNCTFLKIMIVLLSCQLIEHISCLPQRDISNGSNYLSPQRNFSQDNRKVFVKLPVFGFNWQSSFSPSKLFEPLEKINNLIHFKRQKTLHDDNANYNKKENVVNHASVTNSNNALKSNCSDIIGLDCEEQIKLFDEIFRNTDKPNNYISTEVMSTDEILTDSTSTNTEDYESTTIDEDTLNRVGVPPAVVASLLGG